MTRQLAPSDALLNAGLGRLHAGDPAAALEAFSQAATLSPDDALLLTFRAKAHHQLGRRPDALKDLAAALKRGGDNASVLDQAALLTAELGDWERALALSKKAIARSKGQSFSYLTYWRLCGDLGLHDEALSAMRKAVKAAGDSIEPQALDMRIRLLEMLLKADLFAEALTAAAEASARFPGSAQAKALEAKLRLWRGETRAAQALAAEALALDPGSVMARTTLGGALFLQGKRAQALAELDRAAAAAPDEPDARVWRAELLWRQGKAERALVDAEAALSCRDEHLTAHVLRALCLLQLKREEWRRPWHRVVHAASALFPRSKSSLDATPAQAGAALRNVLKQCAGNRSIPPTLLKGGKLIAAHTYGDWFLPELRAALRTIQSRLRFGDPESPLNQFSYVLKHRKWTKKEKALALCHRGEVYLWLLRLDKAAADFKAAIRLESETRWAYAGLCAVLTLRGKLSEALRSADDAIKHGAFAVWVWQGEALRRAGRSQEAAQALESALRATPERVGALVNLALVREDLKQTAEAEHLFERAKAAAPAVLRDAAAAAGPGAPRRKILEAALKLLRGNRSSWMDVYLAPDGRVRNFNDASR